MGKPERSGQEGCKFSANEAHKEGPNVAGWRPVLVSTSKDCGCGAVPFIEMQRLHVAGVGLSIYEDLKPKSFENVICILFTV